MGIRNKICWKSQELSGMGRHKITACSCDNQDGRFVSSYNLVVSNHRKMYVLLFTVRYLKAKFMLNKNKNEYSYYHFIKAKKGNKK